MPGLMHNWFQRHRHPWSLALHAVGIPLLIAALLLGAWQLWHWRWDLWWRPTVLLVISYVLQWIGHSCEGNDLGEVVLVKRLLGRPYVAIAGQREGEVNAGGSGPRSDAGCSTSPPDAGFLTVPRCDADCSPHAADCSPSPPDTGRTPVAAGDA